MLMLPGKVELQVSVWTRGTQEQFIMHVQQAISAIRQKGLKDTYDRLLRTKKENETKLQDANLQAEFASEGQDKPTLHTQQRPLLQPMKRLKQRWPR